MGTKQGNQDLRNSFDTNLNSTMKDPLSLNFKHNSAEYIAIEMEDTSKRKSEPISRPMSVKIDSDQRKVKQIFDKLRRTSNYPIKEEQKLRMKDG